MAPAGHIVLLGPMAAGKTTLGRMLAAALGLEFVDSDDLVVAATGASAADLAAASGVPELHRIERHALRTALERPGQTVVAAAASVVDDPAVRRQLAANVCVGLDANPDVRSSRIAPHRRSMDPIERSLLDADRRSHLDVLCLLTVDTTTASPDECLSAVVGALAGAGVP